MDLQNHYGFTECIYYQPLGGRRFPVLRVGLTRGGSRNFQTLRHHTRKRERWTMRQPRAIGFGSHRLSSELSIT